MRRFLEDLFALLLGHAAQDGKLLTLRLQFLVVVETMENLLLRLVTNGAGVVEDEVSLFYRIHLAISLAHERTDDFLRVMHVHLAAEGLDVKGLSHRGPRRARSWHVGLGRGL